MKIAEALSNKLIKEREKLGISQEEFAFKCGISTTHIGQIERGITSPTIEVLQKIADGLCITVSDLLNFGSELPANKFDSRTNKIIAIIQNKSDFEKAKIYNIIKLVLKTEQ